MIHVAYDRLAGSAYRSNANSQTSLPQTGDFLKVLSTFCAKNMGLAGVRPFLAWVTLAVLQGPKRLRGSIQVSQPRLFGQPLSGFSCPAVQPPRGLLQVVGNGRHRSLGNGALIPLYVHRTGEVRRPVSQQPRWGTSRTFHQYGRMKPLETARYRPNIDTT